MLFLNFSNELKEISKRKYITFPNVMRLLPLKFFTTEKKFILKNLSVNAYDHKWLTDFPNYFCQHAELTTFN